MLDKWTEYLESGGQIDVIYTDFEKAFNKVPHARLVSKLKSYGITKTLIDWITDFLHQRKVNCSYLDWESNERHTTRQCVGAPTICNLYQRPDRLLFHHILQCSDNSLLQSGLNELRDWTQHWLLPVNINKRQVMSVGRNVDKSYKYNITDTNNQPIALESV